MAAEDDRRADLGVQIGAVTDLPIRVFEVAVASIGTDEVQARGATTRPEGAEGSFRDRHGGMGPIRRYGRRRVVVPRPAGGASDVLDT